MFMFLLPNYACIYFLCSQSNGACVSAMTVEGESEITLSQEKKKKKKKKKEEKGKIKTKEKGWFLD